MNKLQQILGMAVLVWPLTLLLIIAISFVVAIALARIAARRRGKSPRAWGWSAVLIVYLIFFWDWLPTVAVHQYYCATEAGFWVYKTPEQWKLENPGVMEGLIAYPGAPSRRDGDDDSFTDTYFMNKRFNWVVKQHGKLLFNRWGHEYGIVDLNTGEVLARYVDFSTSQWLRRPGFAASGWKFWLESEHCSGGRQNKDAIFKIENQFERAGK